MCAAVIIAAATVVWAMWPRQKDDFNHLLKSFQAQQAEIKTLSRLWTDTEEKVGVIQKKLEWHEIKLNTKNEVMRQAFPQEMRVVIERKKALKKAIASREESKSPDYMARG